MSRNVVICCLDTVRQDYFARFAPRLRERADVRFPGCRAASGWSVPSHASMLTGELPHEHGVHTYQPRFDRLDHGETVFGDLPGHEAIGVSANVYAGSPFGFDALFDRFVDVSRDHRFADGLDVSTFVDEHPEPGLGRYLDVLRASVGHDRPLRSLANAACLALDQSTESGLLEAAPTPLDDGAATIVRTFTRLADDAGEPFVGFCNFMEAHEPHRDTLAYDDELYDVDRGWRSTLQPGDVATDGDLGADLDRFRSAYGATIDYLDRRLVDFIDGLDAVTERGTTVIVTADHGENLGSSASGGALGHVTSLSEAVLDVPLLLVDPPAGYPETVPGRVSHTALPDLVRGLARGKTPDVTGDTVAAELLGPTPGNDRLLEHDPDRWDRGLRAVYDGDRKVVWDQDGRVETYEVDAGRPCWQRRVRGTDDSGDGRQVPDGRFATPLADYRQRVRESSSDASLDAGVEERLRDLGYR